MVDAISYDEVYLDSEKKTDNKILVRLKSGKNIEDYGVIYFKIVKHYREEANLIIDSVDDDVRIVDGFHS
jgi:hypothetical protein